MGAQKTSCSCRPCGPRDSYGDPEWPPLAHQRGGWGQWPLWLLVMVGILEASTDGDFYWARPSALLFSLVDEADILLDVGVIVTLFDRGERLFGGLLAAAVVFSQLLIWGSKWARNWGAWMFNSSGRRTAAWGGLELAVFLVEDATTLVVFTQVDGLFNPASWFDVANLATTLFSAAASAAILARWALAQWQGENAGILRAGGTMLAVGLLWNCYLAVGVVALEQPRSAELDLAILVVYGVLGGIAAVGGVISLVVFGTNII